jgi:hypothetical protein
MGAVNGQPQGYPSGRNELPGFDGDAIRGMKGVHVHIEHHFEEPGPRQPAPVPANRSCVSGRI